MTQEAAATPRAPSMLDALIPVIALVFLIGLTIGLFGTDATGGPLQVALLTSALVAGAVALKNGHSTTRVRDAAIGGFGSAMGAIYILLGVGALIGAWNMAGTIPTVVYYGVGLLNEQWFYPATAIICGLVGLAIGGSWTTAATLGVAFVALAPLVGADPVIAAGAVISGAYFGDKMTPISETTVLVPSMVGNVTTQEHIGAMLDLRTGCGDRPGRVRADRAADATVGIGLRSVHRPGCPGLRVLDIADQPPAAGVPDRPLLRRAPPFLAIFASALFAAVMAVFTQPAAVEAFVGETSRGPVGTALQAIYGALATGFVSSTGNETIDALFSAAAWRRC